MRKFLLILFGFFFLGVNAQLPANIPSDGLVGFWPFDGNANDASSNNLNGSVRGAYLTSDRNGIANAAYNFDHVGQVIGKHNKSIYIPYSDKLNVNQITVSLWINLRNYTWSGNPYGSTLIDRFEYGYSTPNGQAWQIFVSKDNRIGAHIMKSDGTVDTDTDGFTTGSAVSPNPIPLNSWHHLALTYDGTTVKLYIDGQLSSSKVFNTPMNVSGYSGISIGESNAANGYWGNVDGKIDDVGMWNRALSDNEILSLYDDYQPTPKRPNITRWKADDATIKLNAHNDYYYTYRNVADSTITGNGYAQTGTTIINLPSPGTYDLEINPVVSFRFNFDSSDLSQQDKDELIELVQWGDVEWNNNLSYMFFGCSKLTITAADIPDFGNVTNMEGLFYNCISISQVPNLNKWNTSLVTNMMGLFAGATLFNEDIGGWDVSNVTMMRGMFSGASSFNQDISKWNTGKVESFENMFTGASMFNQNIGNWNTSKVTTMFGMFQDTTSFNGTIENWDTQNVTNMGQMFASAASFNQNLSKWDTSNVLYMQNMFASAAAFNGDISGWNTGLVRDMSWMFKDAQSFNSYIGGWDMKSVRSVMEMFSGAVSFNQDIGSWNTSNFTEMFRMFYGASSFNQDLNKWDTGNVGSMNYMFYKATNFNGNISNWNTSKVSDMNGVFREATSFNQDISNWNVSNVSEMSQLFYIARSFNQDLGKWKLRPNVDLGYMLSRSGITCENYTRTLWGWADYANTPTGLSLGAEWLSYGDLGKQARDKLIGEKQWTFIGDYYDSSCNATLAVTDFKKENFSIYPNPTSGLFKVNSEESGNLTVFNAAGQNVKRFIVKKGINEFDISGLPSGVYFMNINGKTEKLIKK